MENQYIVRNAYLDGVMGVILGDCVGMPVQFMSREEIKERGPVTGMEGYGTYNKPAGTYSDDSSMTLAAVESIIERDGVDAEDIMHKFVQWLENGCFTQDGQAFDMGYTCTSAIDRYLQYGDIHTCGGTDERSNGNGSLMRNIPVCIYGVYHRDEMTTDQIIAMVDEVSGLTHNHLRSRMACRLYYFLTEAIMDGRETKTLPECVKNGVDTYFNYHKNLKNEDDRLQLSFFDRLRDVDAFADLVAGKISSTGYVIHTIEAAVWSLLNTADYKSCILKAVNLGDDTDTVGAVAGGLAGLYYGYERMPEEWKRTVYFRTQDGESRMLELLDRVFFEHFRHTGFHREVELDVQTVVRFAEDIDLDRWQLVAFPVLEDGTVAAIFEIIIDNDEFRYHVIHYGTDGKNLGEYEFATDDCAVPTVFFRDGMLHAVIDGRDEYRVEQVQYGRKRKELPYTLPYGTGCFSYAGGKGIWTAQRRDGTSECVIADDEKVLKVMEFNEEIEDFTVDAEGGLWILQAEKGREGAGRKEIRHVYPNGEDRFRAPVLKGFGDGIIATADNLLYGATTRNESEAGKVWEYFMFLNNFPSYQPVQCTLVDNAGGRRIMEIDSMSTLGNMAAFLAEDEILIVDMSQPRILDEIEDEE